MKIILLKDVAKIGRKGDVKDVSEGYATNFIFPRKLGILATDENIKKLNLLKSEEEIKKKVSEDLISKNIDTLSTFNIVIKAKSNEKGHLFAGISKEDLVREIENQTRIKADPDWIVLEKPIREVGNHIISIKTQNKTGKLKVEILAE